MVLFIVLLIYIGSSNGIIYCFTERLMYKQC